ncbi:Glycosyl hydrolases family 43 [Gracilimonas mengyeensis]|uniref:Glycosyl hydrolases family 43 n=2 Tax=Gracilimonas mengyeensis TaxID=1302730 RepID=A0A521AYD6_9BACT|nr:Glycosyl hydrolases family 43 [Gracilimonas mengyeensis]
MGVSYTGFAQEHVPGENPIIRDVFTADPAPLVYQDTVFLYVGHDIATGDEMFNIDEWLVYSSTDMKNWEAHGPAMQALDFDWSEGNAWASQVIEKNGKFWFYTTTIDKNTEGDAIGVAVSDKPTGPFKDAIGKPLVVDSMTPTPEDPYDWDDIDPTAFTDDNGTTWIAWGNLHLYLAKMKPNMTEIDGEIQELYLPNFTEGPWIHKREDMYYLSYACFAHQNMWEKICYATAPEITGPWTYRGIITDRTEHSYTIHPAIIEFGDQWYFFYHTGQLTIGDESGAIGRRAVSIEYLYYNEDGTIKPIEKTMEALSIPPNKPSEYVAPVYNPDDSLVTVDTDIKVVQNVATAATSWPNKTVLQTADNPYQSGTNSTSFNAENGVSSMGQTFTPDSDFKLEEIGIYAGDGFGTGANSKVNISLYQLEMDTDTTYTITDNLLGAKENLYINYKPQAPGVLHFELPEDRRPVLEAGQSYVFELQGVSGSAPVLWRHSQGDIYSEGAAWMNRKLMSDEEGNSYSDFIMALYGN